MNTTLTRYGTALLPLAVLALGILDAASKSGSNLLGWQTITQMLLLAATTGAAFWLPLIPGKWSGALKTGAAIVGAVVSALVATIPDGHFTQGTLILFLTAAVKAIAVQVGVSIRTDAAEVIDAGATADEGVPVITSAHLVPLSGELVTAPDPTVLDPATAALNVATVGTSETEQPAAVEQVDAPGKHEASTGA